MNRYEVRTGKWGCYFYDSVDDKDLTLEEILDLLNKSDQSQQEGK